MATREEIIAAQDAWRDAKRAYDDEATKYVGTTWLPTLPHLAPVEAPTREAWDKLMQLRDTEQAAAEAFRAVLDEK